MIIARMTQEHVGRVKRLLDSCFSHAWSEENIIGELHRPDAVCVVCLDGERVVGYLAFEKIGGEGVVAELAVDVRYRRQGIARRLLELVMGAYEDLHSVTLEVRASNTPAIALYTDLGFERVGLRERYYSAPVEDALILTKEIS